MKMRLLLLFLLACFCNVTLADGYIGLYTARPCPSLPGKPWTFTTYYGCHDVFDGRPLNCAFTHRVLGLKEPQSEIANNGGHVHAGDRPMSLNNKPLQTDGYDRDSSAFGVWGFTAEGGRQYETVTHEMPEVSGSLSGDSTVALPLPYICVDDRCYTFNSWRWNDTYEIRIKGLTTDPLPAEGQNHVVRMSDISRRNHPQATHGTPDAIGTLMAIAQEYHDFSG